MPYWVAILYFTIHSLNPAQNIQISSEQGLMDLVNDPFEGGESLEQLRDIDEVQGLFLPHINFFVSSVIIIYRVPYSDHQPFTVFPRSKY